MARVVRASELGEYTYCARAWWLHHVAGETPDAYKRLVAGTSAHRRHGLLVRLSSALLVLSLGLVLVVALLLLMG